MNSSELITSIFSLGTLLSDIVLVLFILCLVSKSNFSKQVISFVGKWAVEISFLLTLGGLVGSLVYSEVVGFEPCILCWIQRLFMYPQVLLLGLALWWKDKGILAYTFAFSVLGALVSLYHSYTQLGGESLTPCTSEGGACSKIYFIEFGYITIPMMALTLFALLIVVYIAAKKKYE